MRDLKYLQYFEDLLQQANNALVEQARADGKVMVAYTCENVPEPLLNLDRAVSIRLSAPNTGSIDIATYYMTNLLCEPSRALLERAIEGGFNFADCVITPDGCTMMNRCVENMELLKTMGKENPNFFHEYMEIAFKNTESDVDLAVLQCTNHVLTPLKEKYGIDTSDAAIRKAVEAHNRVCRVIRAISEFRKEDKPRITGYEFHVLCLATYVCPKYLIIDKLEETLEEIRTREPDEKNWRARVLVVGSETDDSGFIKLIEEQGAFVCCDRFCFGSYPGRVPIELNDEEDALRQVCRHYIQHCHCPRMMSMDKVYGRKQYVAELAKEYRADGVIYNQVKFCDPWAYERTLGSSMLHKDYGYPVLSIDRPYNVSSSVGQLRTRVQAFVESIEIKRIQGGDKA
ncbi:MAG: 2-hydroxyacyl-CoA dehydratase [Oscillospiraceae bacterium]|nr:2-hydroxyacyl-CoA dehydratase [Oscillospiraceae bacterium]